LRNRRLERILSGSFAMAVKRLSNPAPGGHALKSPKVEKPRTENEILKDHARWLNGELPSEKRRRDMAEHLERLRDSPIAVWFQRHCVNLADKRSAAKRASKRKK
jgi:hypothetical protein